MVSEYVNRVRRAFKVVAPLLESSENSQEFLIVGVIVLFHRRKGAGMESNWMYFTIIKEHGKNGSEGIV